MITLNTIIANELPEVALLLGVSGNRLKPHSNVILMKLKGVTPREVRRTDRNFFVFQDAMERFYKEELSALRSHEGEMAIMGYKMNFNFSDQNDYAATLILEKICPCCGRY